MPKGKCRQIRGAAGGSIRERADAVRAAGIGVAKNESVLTKEPTMIRRLATTFLVSAALIGLPTLIGCDREVEHEKTVKDTPTGGTKVEEKTVTKKADGTTETKTETKKIP